MSDPSTAAPRPPSRSRGRRALRGIGIAVLCVAVLASVTLSAAIIYRRVVAERLIARGLALAEIELGAVTVEVFEPTRFAASDLQILNPVNLSIERLEAHYSWSSLGAQRLESVDARGIQLRMELPGESFAIDAAPKLAGLILEKFEFNTFRELRFRSPGTCVLALGPVD